MGIAILVVVVVLVVGVLAVLWWLGADLEASNEIRRRQAERSAMQVRDRIRREGDAARWKIQARAREAERNQDR